MNKQIFIVEFVNTYFKSLKNVKKRDATLLYLPFRI